MALPSSMARKNESALDEEPLFYEYNNGSIISEEQNGRTSEYRYDLLNRQTNVRTLDGKEQENFYDGESAPVRRYLNEIVLSHVQTLEDGLYHAYHQDEQGSTT